jgi:hypothetical protein
VSGVTGRCRPDRQAVVEELEVGDVYGCSPPASLAVATGAKFSVIMS